MNIEVGGHTFMVSNSLGSDHEGMSPYLEGGHTFMVSNSLGSEHEGMSPNKSL